MDLLGRSGVIHRLVPQCLERPLGVDATRDLPVLVLVAPRGGGKTALLDEIEARCARVPHARFDFGGVRDAPPHLVATALSLQLARRCGQFGRLPFPRLSLGLEVMGTSIDQEDWSSARAAVAKLVAGGWRPDRTWAVVGRWADELNRGSGIPADVDRGADRALLRLASWQSRRRRRAAALDWYRGRGRPSAGDAEDVLTELNWKALRRHGGAGETDTVDEVICDAFLSDLRWAFTEDRKASDRTRNCIVLLDNTDTDSGRAFLDILVRLRHNSVTRLPDQCDPLVVLATSTRGDMDGPAPAALEVTRRSDQARAQIPDRASYADWESSRPQPRTWASWRYVVELRDLTEDEVGSFVRSRGLPSLQPLGPFIHRLTHGHPWSVRTVVDAIGAELRTDPRRLDLRRVLDLAPPPDPGGPGATVAERALGYLLQDIPAELIDHLVTGAAAQDLEHMVSAQVGAQTGRSSMPDVAVRLRGALIDNRWLAGEAGDVRRAGLHPLLRRLLLHALAARPEDHPDGWSAVHRRLGESYRVRGEERQALYHDLALGGVGPVAEHLSARLSAANPETWMEDLHAITSAPFRPVLQEAPRETVARLVARMDAVDGDARHEAVSWLVAAMWVANDPLGDPEGTLEDLIVEGLRSLRWHAGWRFDALLDEAAEHRMRSHRRG